MTKFEGERCPTCRVRVAAALGRGRPRTFCSASCRQRMWVARQGATELERTETQLRETRNDLDAVLDDVAALLDALADAWGVDPSDPLRAALESVARDTAVPLVRRLRR